MLLDGLPLGRIRAAALAGFGVDCVIPFVGRLAALGFLRPDAELIARAASAPSPLLERPAPEVQAILPHAAVPWYVIWEVNTTCDLRCQICYLPHFRSPGVVAARAQEIADQIMEAGALSVTLLGGEFLLRSDAEELVSRLRAHELHVKVVTNGHLLTRTRARALALAGLNQVEVSFDGVSPESHDRSRGPGSFARAMSGLAAARAAGIPRAGIVFTVHDQNQGELEQLGAFLDQAGANECYLSLFRRTGERGTTAPWGPPDGAALSSVLQRLREDRKDLQVAVSSACSCGRTSLVIGHDESARSCTFLYAPIGSLREATLRDLWRTWGSLVPEEGPLGYCTRQRPPSLRVR
jgi:MoaA/NifB/PqqE/SkfB family radical SAM enzyme